MSTWTCNAVWYVVGLCCSAFVLLALIVNPSEWCCLLAVGGWELLLVGCYSCRRNERTVGRELLANAIMQQPHTPARHQCLGGCFRMIIIVAGPLIHRQQVVGRNFLSLAYFPFWKKSTLMSSPWCLCVCPSFLVYFGWPVVTKFDMKLTRSESQHNLNLFKL